MTLILGIFIGVFVGITLVALANGNKFDEVYREGVKDGYKQRMRDENIDRNTLHG